MSKSGDIEGAGADAGSLYDRREILRLGAAFGLLSLPGLSACSIVDQGEIRQRAIPSSSALMPVIGLGTSDVFETRPDADLTALREVLRIFTSLGGRLVDTAPSYGNAEDNLGKLFEKLELRDDVFMASKVDRNGQQAGIERMQLSEQKLGTPLDLMQVHNLIDVYTQLKTLRAWKEEGRIRYLGVTHYRVDAHETLAKILQEEDDLDFVQLNYSVVTPDAEKRLLPLAADRGVAVIVNRAFEDGLLFRKTKGKQLPEWAEDFGAESWAQFFLKYVLGNPAVTCVIPGTGDPHHMVDNMSAGVGDMPIESATREKMRKLMAAL